MDEMKPVLHINAGVGWSATKPLCYTFEQNGYCLKGSSTECNVLYYLYEKKYKPVHANYYWHTEHKHRGHDFVRKNTTLGWYIQYIKSHLRDGYKGVCDFSNSNTHLPLRFLLDIAPRLEEEFDVRVTTIWRHPVRRSYSELSTFYRHYTNNVDAPSQWKIRDSAKKLKWRNIKAIYPDSISFWKSQLDTPSYNVPDYVDVYKTWSKAFSKVYPVIMEQVWADPSSLSDFIGHKIEKMHDNVYYPERGTKRPEIKGLRDQWSADLQDLSDDDLTYGKNKLFWLYEKYKSKFGEIPKEWQ